MLGLLAGTEGHGPTPGHRKGAIDGGKIWWVASTNDAARDIIWPDLKRALAGFDKSEQGHTIWLPTGGSIAVKSAESEDSLRGPGLDGVICDEVAHWKERVWKEIIRPMLSDRGGWAIHITTPNGMNWWHDLFRMAQSTSDWETWQRPTSDNPLVTADELAAVQKEIGLRRFNQEYLAQFTEQEGAEFPSSYFPPEMWFAEWPEDAWITCRAIALDPSLGRTDKADLSAIVKIAVDREGCYWVEADLQRRPTAQIVADSLMHYRTFRAVGMGVETNQFQVLLAEQIAAESERQGINGHVVHLHNHIDKRARIRSLTPLLASHRLRFRGDHAGTKMLVDQLRAFPLDRHDDGPDALEMAVRLIGMLQRGEVTYGGAAEERVYA